MKSLFLFVSLCAAIAATSTLSFAQPDSLWSRAYGGAARELAYSVVQTDDGGYILGGRTQSYGAGSDDAWMVKTNAQGDTLWCHTFGGALADYACNVGRCADGGYFVAGTTQSFGAGSADFWLLKTDANGDSAWSRTYGGIEEDDAIWAQQTFDGGYILAGQWHPYVGANFDFWVVKTDANGDTLWTRSFGGAADAGATYVVQTADSGYIVAGVIYPVGDPYDDFWLIRLNANGDSLWSRTYRQTWRDEPWCVRQTMDGGFILVGSSARSNAGITDVWLVKIGVNGDSLWSQTYGVTNAYEAGMSVMQTSDEGYVIAGGTQLGGGPYLGDAWLIRTDGEGNVLWDRTFGGTGDDGAFDIQVTPDGGYILAGFTSLYPAVNYNMWLIKTGPDPVSADGRPVFQPYSYSLTSYPNPFNPSTTIAFDLPKASHVSLRVFDLLGREVVVLKEGMMEAGTYRVTFDGSSFSSGIYFVRLDVGEFTQTRKLMLLK